MDGRTHAIVGAATAVAVAQPKDVSGFVFAVSAGVLGGLYCDVDSKLSKGSKLLNKFLMATVTCITGALAIRMLAPDTVGRLIVFPMAYAKAFIGFLGMLVLAVVGSHTAHRRVTHSIEFILLVFVFAFLISLNFGVFVTAGMLSHSILDLFNKKPVRISLLLKIDVCFNLCSSASRTSNVIATIAMLALVVYPVTLFV